MDIIVCLKQVPDLQQIRIKKETREAVTEGVPFVFGDMDKNALEEAVKIANDSPFGLQSSVFSESIRNALNVAHKLEAGGVMINGAGAFRPGNLPYGGYKQSGVGRESVVETVRDMTEEKAIINVGSVVSDRAIPLQGIYSASKHAVLGYTDALRMELEHDGLPITVTLVKPASINTPYVEHARNYMAEPPYGWSKISTCQRLCGTHLLERIRNAPAAWPNKMTRRCWHAENWWHCWAGSRR